MTAPPRTLIVNADDFGLTAGANAGIIGAFRRGIVRSASLMTTTPGFADAVALARAHPDLDLGIHLALTGVRPARPSRQIPSLVTPNGHFPHLSAWLRRAAAARLDPTEVRAELAAQLARALDTGLHFSHLDGHHHTHLFAPVAAIVADLAREAGIPVIRRINDLPGGGAPPLHSVGEALKRALLATADHRWGHAYAPFARTRAFRGFAFPTTLPAWRTLLRALPPGTTELMCHPGLTDPTIAPLDPYIAEREIELRWLTNPHLPTLLAEHDIILTTFRALAAPARRPYHPSIAPFTAREEADGPSRADRR